MNEIKYLPVNVIKEGVNFSSVYAVGCGENSKFNCENKLLKSPFEIEEVKDYIDTLHVYNNLPCGECDDIWGTYFVKDILDMSPEEFVNKYKEYKNSCPNYVKSEIFYKSLKIVIADAERRNDG